MQGERIERRRLVLLEAADDMRRRRCGIERRKLCGNFVQPGERAAVVILVMALDQLSLDAQQRPGPAEQGCDLIGHGDVSRMRAGAWTSSCGTQPRFAVARSPRLTLDRVSGDDIRQATARRRAMCSAWADALGAGDCD